MEIVPVYDQILAAENDEDGQVASAHALVQFRACPLYANVTNYDDQEDKADEEVEDADKHSYQ